MDAGLKDQIPQSKITGITLLVFEGDIVRDENGHITNKLRETITFSDGNEIPHDVVIEKTIKGESWEL